MIIDIESGPLNIQVIRSSRRTSQISVGPDGQVVFRSPLGVADERIEHFIRQKASWIERVRLNILRRASMRVIPRYQDGASFFLLGEEKVLRVQAGEYIWPKFEVTLSGWDLFVPRDWKEDVVSEEAKKSLGLWYHRAAEMYLSERLVFWAKHMVIEAPVLTLRVQQRLWGSCNSRRCSVNLNRKLIAFPIDIIDYVLIHELCHLRFADHSSRFWKEVGRWCPLFKQHRAWLKNHAPRYGSPL